MRCPIEELDLEEEGLVKILKIDKCECMWRRFLSSLRFKGAVEVIFWADINDV